MRKSLFTVLKLFGVLVLASVTAFYICLHGSIPKIADVHGVEYEKLLNIQPTFGDVWVQCFSGFKDATYYYRLNLSQADFDATGISALRRTASAGRTPSIPGWWNPSVDALWFTGPSMRHGSEALYVYDAKRNLLFARCEM